MAPSFAMNGGDGIYSYTKNSKWQRDGADAVKDLVKEAVTNNLDLEKMYGFGYDSSATTFTIADLGCSVGPNTFHAVQNLIESVQEKYNHNSCNNANLEFQVLFNDKFGNDFNTLFSSLPETRNYCVAGVPGSFNTRLFPSSSVQIVYSSSALHWLSKVPKAVQDKDSPAWNAGKIHCTGAPAGPVVRACEEQFEQDMEAFFRARAQELVRGGLAVILMPGVPQRDVQHHASVTLTFLESVLLELVKEGVLGQDKVDSFNIPIRYSCIKDVKNVVERNGCFEIVKMEIMDGSSKKSETEAEIETAIMHIRAAFEGSLGDHFGEEMVDQIFSMAMQKKDEYARDLNSSKIGVSDLLFVVLKRE